MELSDFLLSHHLFDSMSRDDVQVLEQSMSVADYPDGHVFIKEGKQGNACYMILKGEVSVTRMSTTERCPEQVRMMGPGEMFGLIALIDHGKRAATCTAVGEVTVASLPTVAFELLFQFNAPIAHHFQYVIARQLAHDLREYNHALLDTLFGRSSTDPLTRLRTV